MPILRRDFQRDVLPQRRPTGTAGRDKLIKLWQAPDGRLLRVLEGHEQQVNRVAFHPAGNLLTSASSDHTLKIWEIPSGRLRQTLEGPDSIDEVVFGAGGS